MERGGFGLGATAASLLAVLMLAGPALADTTSAPVQGDAWYSYQADVGALLAAAEQYDPAFRFDLAFQRASLYEVLVPGEPTTITRGDLLDAATAGAIAPSVVASRHVGAGNLVLRPGQGATALVASDPAGLQLHSLPLPAPADPARFLVDALPPLDVVGEDGLRLDPHDLLVAGGLRYALDGLAVQQPLRASATGDLVVVLGRGVAHILEGHNAYARDLAPGPEGERILVVHAQGAVATVEGTGLTAVLQYPEASLGAGAALIADVQGREFGAKPGANVASGTEGLDVRADYALAGALLGVREQAAAQPGQEGQALAYVPLDANVAAAGAALGAVVALAALGLAGLWAGGKHGLVALLAPLYARLQTDEVLANQTREAIFRHVVEHPGVNVSEVVKAFGLGWGATVYHLRVLERSHLLTATKQGRQVCYFQNGGRYNGQMAGISALRNDNAALVARVILEHPGIQQREVCRLTGLAQPTVSWHLQRLEQAGLIHGEGAPRKRYRALAALDDLAQRGFVHGPAPAATAATAPSAAPVAPPASGA